MNEQNGQSREKWKTLKPGVRQRWSQLPEDELDDTQGETERNVDFLEKKYGYSREEAKKEFEDFVVEQEQWSKLSGEIIKDQDKIYE